MTERTLISSYSCRSWLFTGVSLFFLDGTAVSLGYENFDKMAFSMAFKLPDFLTAISWQVLDEADRMLDMGFEPEVRSILSQTCTSMLSVKSFLLSFLFLFLVIFE